MVSTLSGGNQQKVSIAKWLAAQTDILIVDEPRLELTSSESRNSRADRRHRADGVSVLLITSDMAEMVTLADRILVLHGFRIVGEVENNHRYSSTSAAVMNFIHAVEPATVGP